MDKTPTHTPSSASIQSSTPSKTRTFGKSCCVDDPRESSGRRNQLVKILGIATIPVIILTVQSSLNVHDALFDQWAAVNFKADVEFATQASKVIHALQLERGTTVMFLSTVNSTLMPTLIQRWVQPGWKFLFKWFFGTLQRFKIDGFVHEYMRYR